MPLRGGVAAVVAGLLLAAGCGSGAPATSGGASSSPDKATLDCRAQWRSLGAQLAGRDQKPYPSDLADRWNSVLAAVDYYASSAASSDCDAPLTAQRAAADRISAFTRALRVYDVRYRLAQLQGTATAYVRAPTPRKLPESGARRLPPRKIVQTALAVATKTAPAAIADMKDGWAEANAVDLSNPAGRAKALGDLKFLAGDSLPYQRCVAALKVLDRVPRTG